MFNANTEGKQMTANKPATPLPWQSTKRAMQLGVSNVWMTAGGRRVFMGAEGRHVGRAYLPVEPAVVTDMDYAAHTANAYPKLVDALREAIEGLEDFGPDADSYRNRALAALREIGEAA